MKVLLFSQGRKALNKSGIGRARTLQMSALDTASISYTTDLKDNFDVVHINTLFKKSYNLMRKNQKLGIPVIAHGHSTKEDFENSFALWKLIKPWFNRKLIKMYSTANCIVTPTNYSKKLIENYGVIDCPIYALSNGIDLSQYGNLNDEDLKAFKDKFNIKNERVIIGVGLYFERKGLHDFIEVARSFPNYKFIWFGNLNKILTTNLIKKAIKNRPENVIMAGYQTGAIIKSAYMYATACLFPSYEETEGIVVLESLASKTPLIVRDIGVYADWLEDGVNCYKGKNNTDFVNLIKLVSITNNELLTKNGYDVVKKRSIDIVGKSLGEIYQSVIDKNKVNH